MVAHTVAGAEERAVGESKQVSRRIRRRTLGTAFRADPRREPDPQLKQMGDVAWTVRGVVAFIGATRPGIALRIVSGLHRVGISLQALGGRLPLVR